MRNTSLSKILLGTVIYTALTLAFPLQHLSAAIPYYSYQLGCFAKRTDALRAYEKVKGLPQARIEQIGDYYTIRVGL